MSNEARYLPRWRDDMSDGCSVPKLVKVLKPIPSGVRACCVRHDEHYYYGGSEDARLSADLEFLGGLLRAGMLFDEAVLWFRSVHRFGGPEGRRPHVSWAFGGHRFQYDAEPALPIDA